MFWSLLTNPNEFFRSRVERAGLLRPALVVAVVGAIGALAGALYVQKVQASLPSEAQAVGPILLATTVLGGFLGSFVRWLVATVVFYLVSMVFDAQGEFATLLSFVGWGFVPSILATAVSAVVAFLVFSSVTFPTDPQQIQAFTRELRTRPEFLVSSLLGVLFLLWSALLWVFAVKHGRDVTEREAVVTVAIPVAIGLVWRLFGVVT